MRKKYKKYKIKDREIAIKMMRKGYKISEISRIREVPRGTLYEWLFLEKQGILKSEKRGRKHLKIYPSFIQLLIREYQVAKIGSYKMWLKLKNKGFLVSQRQIQKIYNYEGFKLNVRKRPKQIKYVKYEWDNPNDLWHVDWTNCPFTNKQMIAFIDDHSRYLIDASFFEEATAENTILAFSLAVSKCGKPKNILSDNGTQFTSELFEEFCKQNSIKHILARVHHPQTNGKIERWFGTYKSEFHDGFKSLNEFIEYYNKERMHQSLDYKYPIDRYVSEISV